MHRIGSSSSDDSDNISMPSLHAPVTGAQRITHNPETSAISYTQHQSPLSVSVEPPLRNQRPSGISVSIPESSCGICNEGRNSVVGNGRHRCCLHADTPTTILQQHRRGSDAHYHSYHSSHSSASTPLDLFGSLVGSYEESILNGRMSTLPSRPIWFLAEIGVVAIGKCKPSLKCPPHLTLTFPAYFYELLDNESPATPYVGNIDVDWRLAVKETTDGTIISKSATPVSAQETPCHKGSSNAEPHSDTLCSSQLRIQPLPQTPALPKLKSRSKPIEQFGYRLPAKGQLQIIIKNPSRTAVKVFLVQYDLREMPINTKTFIRQKSYALHPAASPSKAGSGSNISSSSAGGNYGNSRRRSSASSTSSLASNSCSGSHGVSSPLSRLRYAVHLQFVCNSKRQIYLTKTIRVVFSHRAPDSDEQLRSVCEGPTHPKFIPLECSNISADSSLPVAIDRCMHPIMPSVSVTKYATKAADTASATSEASLGYMGISSVASSAERSLMNSGTDKIKINGQSDLPISVPTDNVDHILGTSGASIARIKQVPTHVHSGFEVLDVVLPAEREDQVNPCALPVMPSRSGPFDTVLPKDTTSITDKSALFGQYVHSSKDQAPSLLSCEDAHADLADILFTSSLGNTLTSLPVAMSVPEVASIPYATPAASMLHLALSTASASTECMVYGAAYDRSARCVVGVSHPRDLLLAATSGSDGGFHEGLFVDANVKHMSDTTAVSIRMPDTPLDGYGRDLLADGNSQSLRGCEDDLYSTSLCSNGEVKDLGRSAGMGEEEDCIDSDRVCSMRRTSRSALAANTDARPKTEERFMMR
ncbi:hypothetical protein BASA50_008802 [Batrachochytrium salamandrivorans]|uniref:Atos-like conserved domain-containing protein n=1 Tax=Batrachochytrium salamandrivorans TaxID=1357716 RepID=A0ABQ8F688_9FUNG|nr:hypothetical protein BASA61_008576 [Batrachochytrium salamandrivorans]KAH6591300.1 hypothetical protein BASA50_008802 [Batrachochytrium salamandrivorans]